MTEYVFHIGPHKTGSTYLQNSFCALRGELTKRGISYPTKWQTFLTGHHALAMELRAKKIESLREGFKELSAEKIVVFSSEDFSTLEPASLLLLKELIGDSKAKFIFYCRRWSELLPSCWQEDVKQGASETLPEYYLPRLADPLRSNILNFSLVLDRFAAIFGLESIGIVSYSNLLDKKADLFHQFLTQVLGSPEEDFAFPAPTFPNVSLDYFDIEIIRVLNTFSLKLNNARSPEIRDLYLGKKAKLNLSYVSEQINADRARIAVDDGAYALNCLYSYINDKYKNSVIGEDKNIFSQQKGKPYVYVRPGYLLNPRVVDEFRGLYAELKDSSQRPISAEKLLPERAG
jgi:hypothetical protein